MDPQTPSYDVDRIWTVPNALSFLRLLGVLVLVAVIGGFVSYLLTGNEKYLRFAGRLFRYALIVAFLLFALLILERVAVIPL